MIWFKTIFLLCCLKVSSIPIAITKISCLNVFIFIYIVCGRHRIIKCPSNHIPRSEGHNRLLINVCICMPPCNLFVQTWHVISAFHCAIAERARMKRIIIVILCALYCNVFSPVNETWGNLTALHSTLHQCHLAFMCFGGGVALESDLHGGWDLTLLMLTYSNLI